MNDDLLKRAASALRETGEPSRDEAALTRARILSSLRERERLRVRKVVVFLPLAAVLVATTALAAPEGSLARAWDRAMSLVGLETKEPVRSQRSEPLLAVPVPVPVPVPESPAPEPAVEAGDLETPRGEESQERQGFVGAEAAPTRPRPPFPTPVPVPAPVSAPTPAPAPSPDAEHLALYERAHLLHFIANDYPAALAAWDAYLQSSPKGSLSIEARYNRAITLVRLARKDEALRALEPFARGEVASGYRQAEARALSTALQREPSLDISNQ